MATRPRPRRWRRIGITLGILALCLLAVGGGGWWLSTNTALLPASLRQPAPAGARATDRVEAWRQDVAYLVRELPRLHVNAFHSTDRATWAAAVAALEADLDTLSDDEIMVRLLALAALVGDGHTEFQAAPLYGGTTYPIRLTKLQEDWVVWSAAADHADLVGARLRHVDGTPVDALAVLLTPLVSADNDAQRQAILPGLLTAPPIVAALGIVADANAPQFTFTDINGETVTRGLSPVAVDPQFAGWVSMRERFPVEPPPLALTHPELWYWAEPLPDSNALFFQYDVCADMEGRPFAPFAQELFATVDGQGLTRVIVDLRANGGGDSRIFKPFLDGMAARPNLEVYALIGRNTFSSALMNAIELQQRGAVLVGEPTGGRPNHYGEVRAFTLPNSGLRVRYATRYFRMLRDADPPALEPDIATPITLENQIAGIDAALTAALAHTR